MTTKKNNPGRLTKALLETAKDMKDAGVLGKSTYEKITMRHLSLKDKNKLVEPLTGKDIRMIREQARLSQAVFARYLNLTVGYVSQLERGSKRPIGAALVLLNVIHRKGIEAIL
jgi:putative transcriptional regulator